MMSNASLDVLAVVQRLHQQDEPCALVTVLRVQAPASARPGDKAVVSADGIVAGWIGGGCAQPAVVKTVRQALADGRARLIRIAPAEEGEMRELNDVLEFGMACHSGGTLELFVDPLLPRAQLVIVGDSPVAMALAGLAPRVGLQETVVAQGADASRFPEAAQVIASDDVAELPARIAPGAFVVVATQGRRDVQGLRAALALRARQVGFVASERKAQVLRAALVEAGQDEQAVAAIVAPAGHAIGAQTPEEIALSVLSAVVAARRGQAAPAKAPAAVARPRPLPLPELPPVAGSCCGGVAATAAVGPEPVAVPQGSGCAGT
jgi:xanthine dehydrogenase accessory factor